MILIIRAFHRVIRFAAKFSTDFLAIVGRRPKPSSVKQQVALCRSELLLIGMDHSHSRCALAAGSGGRSAAMRSRG